MVIKAAKKECMIRSDVRQRRESVPLQSYGKTHYLSPSRTVYKYRWVGRHFQILFGGKWWTAQSIDFDFS